MFKKSTDQQKKPLISIFKNKDVVPSFLPYTVHVEIKIIRKLIKI